MNSGFSPAVVNPSGFKVQRQSQQTPFYFGGSQVPLQQMIGSGVMKVNRPPVHLGMRGGMLVEAEDDEIYINDLQNNILVDMIESTRDLLEDERARPNLPANIQHNIHMKILRWGGPNGGIRRRLENILNNNENNPITMTLYNQIVMYIQDYIQRPVQPYQPPNFLPMPQMPNF